LMTFVARRQPDGTRYSAHVLRIWLKAKSSPFTSLRIVRRRADAGERSGAQLIVVPKNFAQMLGGMYCRAK
jgi:hypothetical protein